MSLRPAKQNAVVNRETCYTASGKGEVESSKVHPAGDEANHEQKHPDADPCERIRRLHSKQLRAHESYARCRSYQAQPETNRETKANLSCALPDDIRHHAVKTHSRQQQRHHAEDSGESRQHALCFDRAIEFIDQSPWTRQRQLRIQ